MTKIKGHTVGSDGIVYNPDTASFGYVSSMDSRNENNSSDERGALVTDQGRLVVVNNPAVGQVATGAGGGGSGPGASATGAASGGAGPGSAVVLSGVGETGPIKGVLKTKLKPEVTRLMVGGDWWLPNPWFSNADQWEERMGEPGDWIGGVVVGGADAAYNTMRLGEHLGTTYVGPGVYHTERAALDWLDDAKARVTSPMPVQEPVDWGQ